MGCWSASVRWARLLLAVALLGGCSGGRDDDTLPPPASTSTSVAYSVPEVIDVAYVEKVMAALDHVYGDAIRILARERTITEDFLDRLAAIYTPSEFALVQDVWVKDVALGLQGLRTDPGDPTTQVDELLRSDKDCIVGKVTRSFVATRERVEPSPHQRFIGLIPKPEKPSGDLNPTPWVLSFDGFKTDGNEPSTPCAAE